MGLSADLKAKRYYIPVSPFGIVKFIKALNNDPSVQDIQVSTSDDSLLVSYDVVEIYPSKEGANCGSEKK